MSEERPETCEKCGAPFVWCMCEPDYKALRTELAKWESGEIFSANAAKLYGDLRAENDTLRKLLTIYEAALHDIATNANGAEYGYWANRKAAKALEANHDPTQN